ncbi:MAG: hypothetical protein ACKOW2_05980 [Sphingobacteriaceae bacterium]
MKTKPILSAIYVVFIIAFLFIISYSCSKNDLQFGTNVGNPPSKNLTTSQNTLINLPFKATVGAPLELKTGIKWIANYKSLNGGKNKEHFVASKDLQAILRDPDCVGICLYFAIDDNNQELLIPIGVNSKGYLMKTSAISTLNGQISWETAQTWIANDPGLIDARFFGRNTFSRLFNTPNCQKVRAIYALDDDKKPQLLLVDAALDYNKVNFSTASSSQFRFEDASFPCPPVCPLSN